MAEASGTWDEGGGESQWLRPDERVYWRGRPDPSVVFSRQDLYLVPFSLAWTAFVAFWEHGVVASRWTIDGIFGIPFLVVGAYLMVGRFLVKVWSRRRTEYVVTNQRAVEMQKRGRASREVAPLARVELRPGRDGTRGTVIFGRSDDWNPSRRLWGNFATPAMAPYLRGTFWPGSNSFDEVVFFDVEGFEELVAAARSAGFNVSERSSTPVSSLYAGPTPPPSGGVRVWIRTRLGRVPYSLWSPLPPPEVAGRLAQNLAPFKPFSFGFRQQERYQGTVSGSWVRLMCVGPMQGNSWRLVFEGTIVGDGLGTRLDGTLGPNRFVPVFSAIWVVFVSLFFVGGTIGFVSDLASGHGASLLPFVLIPAVMIVMFFAITEFGSRSARSEWANMDRWLRRLLEVPS